MRFGEGRLSKTGHFGAQEGPVLGKLTAIGYKNHHVIGREPD